jgi:hypothetical protein
MKPEKIRRLRGMLCRMIDGTVFLRVRKPHGRDRDYDIAHCDLQIDVCDADAYVYRRNGRLVIDYGPATLGIEGGEAGTGKSKCRTRRRTVRRAARRP